MVKIFAGTKTLFYLCTRLRKAHGAIAQLVEQRTENPCVPGSIPGGTTAKAEELLNRVAPLIVLAPLRISLQVQRLSADWACAAGGILLTKTNRHHIRDETTDMYGAGSGFAGLPYSCIGTVEEHAEACECLFPAIAEGAAGGSPDKLRGLSIQPCKSEKEEFYIRHSSQGRSECLYLRIE